MEMIVITFVVVLFTAFVFLMGYTIGKNKGFNTACDIMRDEYENSKYFDI